MIKADYKLLITLPFLIIKFLLYAIYPILALTFIYVVLYGIYKKLFGKKTNQIDEGFSGGSAKKYPGDKD